MAERLDSGGAGLTLALGGDTMLGRMVGRALLERPPGSVWHESLLALLGSTDGAVVNLECCISGRGDRWADPAKPFFFRAPPEAVEALQAAGVRGVWLANNHALDYGEIALLDTFDHLARSGIAWAGAGRNLAEARRGAVIEPAGVPIGLVGFADHPADFAATDESPGIAWVDPVELASSGPPRWLLDEVSRLAEECEAVIVGPHWGPNMATHPQPHHRAVARDLLRAGAALVCGHSAHLVQPVAQIENKPVLFDLGDLLDDYAIDEHLRNDIGLLALYQPGVSLELVPLRLEYTRTRLASGADRAWLVRRLLDAARREGLRLVEQDGRLVLPLKG